MKKLILAGLLAMQVVQAQAQFFSREALGGAALGGIIGGVVGHNNGRKTAEGAAIGAGAGLLIGAITHEARRERGYYSEPAPAPSYSSYHRPNYAVAGAVVGGVAGGVIGHNNGRHTAEGIAIGAGAGLLLGGVAEYHARRRELIYPPAPVTYVQTPTVVTTVPVQVQPAPQQITVINNYYSQPAAMNSANSLFGR
ncbi:MAG: YMGG-like glycine zipper-containing protein [Verrucomicrobiales bacterium]